MESRSRHFYVLDFEAFFVGKSFFAKMKWYNAIVDQKESRSRHFYVVDFEACFVGMQ